VWASQEFKAFYLSYFTGKADVSVIDWDAWFYGVNGLPETPVLDVSMRSSANRLAAEWCALSPFSLRIQVSFLRTPLPCLSAMFCARRGVRDVDGVDVVVSS
jgi:hypothetical protein